MMNRFYFRGCQLPAQPLIGRGVICALDLWRFPPSPWAVTLFCCCRPVIFRTQSFTVAQCSHSTSRWKTVEMTVVFSSFSFISFQIWFFSYTWHLYVPFTFVQYLTFAFVQSDILCFIVDCSRVFIIECSASDDLPAIYWQYCSYK